MRIRLMGAPDLVKAWARHLEDQYGVSGRTYPSRRGPDLRWYGDLDDRRAAELMKRQMGEE